MDSWTVTLREKSLTKIQSATGLFLMVITHVLVGWLHKGLQLAESMSLCTIN